MAYVTPKQALHCSSSGYWHDTFWAGITARCMGSCSDAIRASNTHYYLVPTKILPVARKEANSKSTGRGLRLHEQRSAGAEERKT
jgi:hypothetical protein